LKNLIRQILKEAREPIHGVGLPAKWHEDGNTRKTFEANGIKYRIIYPFHTERNGRITMQVTPYEPKDIAIYGEYKDKGPYAQEKHYSDGTIYEWVKESGDIVYSALSSYINSEHDWYVSKREEEHGYLIYISMDIHELIEDYLNIADEGNPFNSIQ
jgi:hypothetical protein